MLAWFDIIEATLPDVAIREKIYSKKPDFITDGAHGNIYAHRERFRDVYTGRAVLPIMRW